MSVTAATTTHVRAESEFGSWELASRPPHPALAPYVRGYQDYREEEAPVARREVPTGDVALIISWGAKLEVSGPRYDALRPTSFIVGVHDAYAVVEPREPWAGMQVDLTPIGAHMLLGVPMGELTNRLVALEDVLGPATGALVERLFEAAGSDARFDILESALLGRLDRARAPSPDVDWAWRRLVATHGAVEVGLLTEELGCSRRHLAARFREQVGVAPKALARILRFRRVLELIERDGVAGWADIAVRCGYYDQSHLNRDFRDFAGHTPSEYLARLLPNGGGLSAV
jgi:AraC-like DNA-binding protein